MGSVCSDYCSWNPESFRAIMTALTKLVLCAALAIGAVAAPTHHTPSTFTVNQVARKVPTKKVNIPAAYARTLKKFKATVPEAVAAAAVVEDTAALPFVVARDVPFTAFRVGPFSRFSPPLT